MLRVIPKSGTMGEIKAPTAITTTGIKLFHPDFKIAYDCLDKDDRVRAALTGYFDYQWEYLVEEEAYLLTVDYYQGKIKFAVQFPKNTAGQILQSFAASDQRVFALILKHQENSRMLFDDAVVLMGMELDISPEAGWPVRRLVK
ncbi:hypothetical protein M1N64_04210 [Peptococcaceae bacterium]|nr:hypothetical protein [Peptococcaceae bacterium]